MPKHDDPLCEAFAQNYVQHLDQQRAYRETYEQYSPDFFNSEGERAKLRKRAGAMIRRKGVKDRINELLAQRSIATESRLRKEYEVIAFSKITDVVEFGTQEVIVRDKEGNEVIAEDGTIKTEKVPFLYVKNSQDLPPDVAHAIKAVKQTANGITVEMHDKMGALEKLSKPHAGLQGNGDGGEGDDKDPVLLIFNKDDPASVEDMRELQRREEAAVIAGEDDEEEDI